MTGEIRIRDAAPSDVKLLAQFLTPFVDAELILPRDDDELLVLMQHGFVAERASELVGFAAIEIYSKKMAEVQAMAVAESCRGQGVGASLLNECVQRAVREGVLELMAITMSEALFRRAGFDYALPNQKRAMFLQTRPTKESPSKEPPSNE